MHMAGPGCSVRACGYLGWESIEDLAEVAGAFAAGVESVIFHSGGDVVGEIHQGYNRAKRCI